MLFPLDRLSSLFMCILSGVRRLIIVEAGSNRVEGIISLSDVFKFLLGYPEFVGHHFT